MSMTGSASGTVSLGDPNNPDLQIPINPTTGTITQYAKIKKIIAQNQTNQALDIGNITSVTFIYLKFTNTSTGAVQYATVRLNGTITMPDVTDYMHCHGATPGTAITAISISTQAAAGNTTVDGVVAGT